MNLVLAKLFWKIDERTLAEDCLQEVPFCPPPEEGLSKFLGSLGDLCFDLEQPEFAEERYSKCIRTSNDPQSLTRIQFRLKRLNQAKIGNKSQATDSPSTELAPAYFSLADFCWSRNEPCLAEGFGKKASVLLETSS
jgi:hypothetical protein